MLCMPVIIGTQYENGYSLIDVICVPAGTRDKYYIRPRLRRSARILTTAFFASSGSLPPVMISFPEPKRRTTTLGFSSRYTRPGNCSGSYSIRSRLNPTAILLRLIAVARSAEEKNYDLGVLKPVHKARELFGLVLDPVEIEPYSDLIEVDRCREIGRGNDVLDLVGEFFRDIDTQTAELVAQNREPLGEAVNALCPGQDYLS